MPKRKKTSATRQKAKFRAAAKKCKGLKLAAFRACMRKALKK